MLNPQEYLEKLKQKLEEDRKLKELQDYREVQEFMNQNTAERSPSAALCQPIAAKPDACEHASSESRESWQTTATDDCGTEQTGETNGPCRPLQKIETFEPACGLPASESDPVCATETEPGCESPIETKCETSCDQESACEPNQCCPHEAACETATFEGSVHDYSIKDLGDGMCQLIGCEGTDLLSDVTCLEFCDGKLDLRTMSFEPKANPAASNDSDEADQDCQPCRETCREPACESESSEESCVDAVESHCGAEPCEASCETGCDSICESPNESICEKEAACEAEVGPGDECDSNLPTVAANTSSDCGVNPEFRDTDCQPGLAGCEAVCESGETGDHETGPTRSNEGMCSENGPELESPAEAERYQTIPVVCENDESCEEPCEEPAAHSYGWFPPIDTTMPIGG